MAAQLDFGPPPKGTNSDLALERSRASFNPEEITHLLDGGPNRTVRRRRLQDIIENDPTDIFSNEENNYLSRTDRHVRAMAKSVRLLEICRSLGVGEENDSAVPGEVSLSPDFETLQYAIADDPLPVSLHWYMFVPNIITLCDDEQKARWLPLCRDFRMIGCYAQTELGHGSNVRGLETTATFLSEGNGGQKGGSWVINSPTVTSLKFWPGTLGRTCNHAMVVARLVDGSGKDHGVHNFLVRTRRDEDHSLMPGVTTGDIGPKIGYNNMDNGFAKFDKVLIPRRNMFMRFTTVDEDGVYRTGNASDAASKVAYITMMQVRSFIIEAAGKSLARACIIAVRYSVVRRQGFADPKTNTELQVLDYPQQRLRLLSHLAASYCFTFMGKRIRRTLKDIEKGLLSGDTTISKEKVGDIHASSSALKSFTTTAAAYAIEDCRRACGGHGFLMCSGLPELYTTYLQNPTVEGDNNMLPQQVIKVLLKLVGHVRTNDERRMAEWTQCDAGYLVEPVKSMLTTTTGNDVHCTAHNASDMSTTEIILAAYRHRSARLLLVVDSELINSENDWNASQPAMARASVAHALYLLLRSFVDEIASSSLGSNESRVLTDLARLFGLRWMEEHIGDFLEDGYLSAEQTGWVRSGVARMTEILRPDAVSLVDSWDVPDFQLKSALGRWDGNVYHAILSSSVRDPLNKTEPGPGYQHLRRLIVDGVAAHKGGVRSTASRL